MSAHFTSHYLAEILRDLYFQESSGAIHLRSPRGETITLHFDRGMLHFASGSDPADDLAHHLSELGILPARTITKLKALSREPIELAARLVATGVLTKDAIAPAIRSLLAGAVDRAFCWPGGTSEFETGDAPAGFFDADVLFTLESILRGISRMANFDPLREVLLALPGRLRLSGTPFLPVDRLALKPQHGYILSRMDGSMRLEEIALLLPQAEQDDSLQFIYGLAVLGIVEFDPPVSAGLFSLREVMTTYAEASARDRQDMALIRTATSKMSGQSPAEVLGVPPGCDRAGLQQAFDLARARFRRDRFSDRVREKCKKDLTLLENRLTEAFLKLQVDRLEQAGRAAGGDVPLSEINPDDLVVRREMVKTEAQATKEQNLKVAEKYYQKAREHALEKKYHDCIQFCRLAIKFNEELAPAQALMADALARNPNARWQREAEEAWVKACELDPWNAEYHVGLGMFYRGQGMEIRARRQFEKALEILPSHAVAREALKPRRR